MKKKTISILTVIVVNLFIVSLVANYYDTARVTTGHEPKLVIETYSEKHDAVIYWGLGYKVVRYVSVSPKEPYENSIKVKKGSWFMSYEKPTNVQIFIEEIETGEVNEVNLLKDVNILINLIENQKYIEEPCDGIIDYKIVTEKDTYKIKTGCSGINFEGKEAHLSDEDMESLIQLLEKY